MRWKPAPSSEHPAVTTRRLYRALVATSGSGRDRLLCAWAPVPVLLADARAEAGAPGPLLVARSPWGVRLFGRQRPDRRAMVYHWNLDQSAAIGMGRLEPDPLAPWSHPLRLALYAFLSAGHPIPGMEAVLDTDPGPFTGAHLASSPQDEAATLAALCAFVLKQGGLQLDGSACAGVIGEVAAQLPVAADLLGHLGQSPGLARSLLAAALAAGEPGALVWVDAAGEVHRLPAFPPGVELIVAGAPQSGWEAGVSPTGGQEVAAAVRAAEGGDWSSVGRLIGSAVSSPAGAPAGAAGGRPGEQQGSRHGGQADGWLLELRQAPGVLGAGIEPYTGRLVVLSEGEGAAPGVARLVERLLQEPGPAGAKADGPGVRGSAGRAAATGEATPSLGSAPAGRFVRFRPCAGPEVNLIVGRKAGA